VVRVTEQLSAVVGQRSGPSAVVEERGTGDDTGSVNEDRKHERDLPKQLLLEAAMQTRLPSSSPTPSPVAVTDNKMGNEGVRVGDTLAITDEEQEDATIEQGKLRNNEPVDKEPGDASDPNRTQAEIQSGRRSQDADTLLSWSPLSTPPASDDQQDRTSYDSGDEPKSLAASIESPTLDDSPSGLSQSAVAKARQGLASHRDAVHRQRTMRTYKVANTLDVDVDSGDEEILVDNGHSTNDEDWTQELQLTDGEAYNPSHRKQVSGCRGMVI